jgi:putative copper export protein
MFEWSEIVRELLGFVFSFFATGAVAFRLFVLRGRKEPEIFAPAVRRAAIIGLIGAIGRLFLFFGISLPRAAARQHTTIAHAMTTNPTVIVQSVCVLLLVIALGLALSRVDVAWYAAAVAVLVTPFAGWLTGPWTRIVNPVHVLAGGLWIGTLFVMLVAGFRTVMRSGADAARRGQLAAEMVHSFSPLALGAFGLLAFSGVNSAIRHLKRWDAIWTTPYGNAFVVKMSVVVVVIALGAWNWRRQRPLLGTESAASVLKRSATAELAAATVVLLITAVLVTLPHPNSTRAKRRFPTFRMYERPADVSSVWRGSSIFTSSTRTPPCATVRWASLFDSASPAATMIFVRNCGSPLAGRLTS